MPGTREKSFEDRLVEAGLVSPRILEQARKEQHLTDLRLGEWLVDIGIIEERKYLEFVASVLGTRFVSAAKLAQAEPSDAALAKVPVRSAEAACLVPIAYDAERNALSVVMVEPRDEPARQQLAAESGVAELHAFVAMRSSVRAAIKKFYYGAKDAFTPEGEPVLPPFRCPECGAPAEQNDFQCPRCELLINPSALLVQSVELEPSVVRYMLSSPEATPSALIPPEVIDATDEGPPLEPGDVVRIMPGIDAAAKRLHPFEAFVATFVDGVQNIRSVAKAADLDERRVLLVIRVLCVKHVLEPVTVKGAPWQEAGDTATDEESLMQRAVALERAGDLQAAVGLLKGGIARMKSPARLYNRLALVLVLLKRDLHVAEECLRKALEIDPKNPVYRRNHLKVAALLSQSRKR